MIEMQLRRAWRGWAVAPGADLSTAGSIATRAIRYIAHVDGAVEAVPSHRNCHRAPTTAVECLCKCWGIVHGVIVRQRTKRRHGAIDR